MKAILFLLAATLLLACNNPNSPKAETPDGQAQWGLEEIWQSDTLMRTCESVLLDKEGQQLIVTCINGEPWEKDGQGFVGLLNLDGSLKTERWVTGLDAPKGTGMMNGLLYVADMDQIVVIDIAGAGILKKIPVEGARQLNDVAVAADGSIYFSDSHTGWIWTLRDDQPEQWIGGFERPNGLLAEEGRVLLASSQSADLRSLDRESGEATILSTGIGHGDGIVFTGKEGHYLVSDWSGEIFLVHPDYSTTSLLHTKDKGINTADLAFDQEKQILYVPTFFGNHVVAYKLVH
jgi:hypothetical protein